MLTTPMNASGDDAPRSPLQSIYYRVAGGMLPGEEDFAHLRTEADGRRLLTVSGDCRDERVTFEVADSVFRRCEELIRTTQVYASTGFYRSEFRILDAPSTDFTVRFDDPGDNFSAGGDIPFDISTGIRTITDYLKSLRNGRQATGHMGRIASVPLEALMNTVWTNGDTVYEADSTGIPELLEFLCDDFGIDFSPYGWRHWITAGSGFRCLVVECEEYSIVEVFQDKATLGHTIRTGEDIPGQWPETARRPFLNADLEDIPSDTLYLMWGEILARYGENTYDAALQTYFARQPWYGKSPCQGQRITDLEQQNAFLFNAEIIRRRKMKAE